MSNTPKPEILRWITEMSAFKVGRRVEIAGKDVQGVIAFYGPTSFASGKWIGVKLDEPKGKNNGSVKGQVYFQVRSNRQINDFTQTT